MLEQVGRYFWTEISCGFERLVQNERSGFTNKEELKEISKFNTFEGWGHTVFFKAVPLVGALLCTSKVGGGVSLLFLGVVLYFTRGFSTAEDIFDRKDNLDSL